MAAVLVQAPRCFDASMEQKRRKAARVWAREHVPMPVPPACLCLQIGASLIGWAAC